LAEALKQYDRSLQIRQKFPQHPDTAMVMFNQSLIHESQGNLIQATRLLNECQKILKDSLGTKHKFYGHTESALASIFDQDGKYKEALEKFKCALEIYSSLGEESIEFRMTLSNIGLVYDQQRNYKDSLAFLERRMRIEHNLVGEMKSTYERSIEKARAVKLKLVEEESGNGNGKDIDKLRFGYLECFLGAYSNSYGKSFSPSLRRLAEIHFESATPLPSNLKYDASFSQFIIKTIERSGTNNMYTWQLCHLSLSVLYKLIANNECVLLKPTQSGLTCDWTYISIGKNRNSFLIFIFIYEIFFFFS